MKGEVCHLVGSCGIGVLLLGLLVGCTGAVLVFFGIGSQCVPALGLVAIRH